MPAAPGLERDLEAEPAIGVDGARSPSMRPNVTARMEIGVAICRAQFLLVVRPFRGDAAAAHDAARFTSKMSAKSERMAISRLKRTALAAVIGDVEVLVHAAGDGPAHDEAEGARRDRAVLGQEAAVGQEDARGVVGDGAAVQQIPGLAVGVDRPAAQQTRVEEIQALLTAS